jgi:hypothetical protein
VWDTRGGAADVEVSHWMHVAEVFPSISGPRGLGSVHGRPSTPTHPSPSSHPSRPPSVDVARQRMLCSAQFLAAKATGQHGGGAVQVANPNDATILALHAPSWWWRYVGWWPFLRGRRYSASVPMEMVFSATWFTVCCLPLLRRSMHMGRAKSCTATIDADNNDAQGHRYLHQGVAVTLNRPLLEHQRKR